MMPRPSSTMPWVLRGGFVVVALVAFAACGGGGVKTTPYVAPTVMPTTGPTPTASPVAAPASVATTVPLTLSGSGNAISAASLPAPVGYTSHLTVPQVTAAAGTTVAFTSSVTLPASVPVLGKGRAVAQSVRIPQATSGLTAIFFDSLVPSANITVAGAVSIAQAFPSGTLTASTPYYLAFYDSTQPSPAWQTINGPITTSDGLTLTFSGNVGSTTLQAGALYAFAVFTLGSSSTTTPPPAPQTLAYIANSHQGITIVNAAGTNPTSLPIDVEDIGLDDSGNIFSILPAPVPSPVGSGSPTPAPVAPAIARYPAGSSTASTTYTPSNAGGVFILTAGTGAFATFGGNADNSQAIYDVWDPGKTGTPSRTITEPISGSFFGLMAHDGTLYTQHINTNGTFQYDVYAPGSSTIARTIAETVVSAANQPYFYPNYAAVGADGTLYVTEYAFYQPDALAGLYVYPPNGAEYFVATTSNGNGAGPQGVDVDASGNIYIANNNAAASQSGALADTLHDIEVFGPGGTNPRHITGAFDAYPIAASADGTAFFSSFPSYGDQQTGVQGTFSIAPGTSMPTNLVTFGSTTVVLYDGNRETTGLRRSAASIGSGAGAHGPGGPPSAAALAHRMTAFAHRRQ